MPEELRLLQRYFPELTAAWFDATPGGAAPQKVLRAWGGALEAEEPGGPGRARWRWPAAEVGRGPQGDGDWLACMEPACWSAGGGGAGLTRGCTVVGYLLRGGASLRGGAAPRAGRARRALGARAAGSRGQEGAADADEAAEEIASPYALPVRGVVPGLRLRKRAFGATSVREEE